ncbi:MAG: TRAP transporter small permease [Sphingomonadales bacterium]
MKFISGMERLGLYLAAGALTLLVLLGLAEILLRAAFNTGISISLEYSGYLLAVAFLAGSGWTLSEGGHIRMTLLSDRLNASQQRLARLLTATIGLLTSITLTAGLVTWTAGTFLRGTVSFYPSATPLWLPQAFLTLAAMILSLSILGELIRIWRGSGETQKSGDGSSTGEAP